MSVAHRFVTKIFKIKKKAFRTDLVYRKHPADVVVAGISGSSGITKCDPVKPQLENLGHYNAGPEVVSLQIPILF